MKSFSKRVASFAMAAAMVCSLAVVSPVDAEAAAKPKFEKTRTAITAGTNYTYAVKNVTSKQYVKVYATTGIAVKYNNAKVTKGKTEIKGGKTIKVKINANEKVANYKGKVTVKVFNKKTNKKVKDLSDSFTVKCTKLAVTSVEPATLAGTHKYVVVNFNKALKSLDPSEVIIRKKATNELVTVEKVVLAANGKSATLTLLGDANVLGTTTYLVPNVDYVLTVVKSGASASMDFNFPAVAAEVSVVKVDATNRTINGTFKVPTTIDVDFQELLGRTVTFWYDKNNEITKWVVADETVVYGAFTATTKTGANEFALKTSDAKYLTTSGNAFTSSIKDTKFIRISDGANVDPSTVSGNDVAYAKLVLNQNGTIRTATYLASMPNNILVNSVAGNVITESKTVAANLKDYTIVKDGKTKTIADIQAGDVVIYNSTVKYAEIYNQTVSGVVTNVTDAKVTVTDKSYEYASPKYIEGNETKNADTDYFSALKKTAKDATVYLNRFGKVIYASGDKGAVATTTREIIVKGDTKAYTLGLESYIKFNASDATDVAVPEVKLSDLKSVKWAGTLYSKDVNDETGKVKVKSFDSFSVVTPNNVLSGINITKDTGSAAYTIPVSTAKTNAVTLILDAANSKVIGLEFSAKNDTVSTNEAFEKGKSIIQGVSANYQILSSTPVFEITKDAASVTKTTYGEYTKKTKKENNTNIALYTNNGNITKVVIDNQADNMYDVTDNATVTGIVTARETLNSKTVLLTVVSEGKELKFTSFADTVSANGANAVAGDIASVTYDKNTNKVSVVGKVTANVTTVSYNTKDAAVSTNAIANGKIEGCDLATAIAPTIITKDGGVWKTITYGELSDIAAATDYSKNYVEVKYHEMTSKVIDYVVVEVK